MDGSAIFFAEIAPSIEPTRGIMKAQESDENRDGDCILQPNATKSTHITEGGKKAPTLQTDKVPTLQKGKEPTNYLPRVLLVVGNGEEDLHQLLQKQKLAEWNTNYRRKGLLFLMNFLIGKNKAKGFALSLELGREYIGAIKTPKNEKTIRQPMHLLVEIEWLEVVTPFKTGPHQKHSSVYRIPPRLIATKRKSEVFLPPKLIKKMENAAPRNERRLNRKQPFRAQLLLDLRRVSISDEGRKVIHRLRAEDEKKSAIKQVLRLIDGDAAAKVSADHSETITTNLSQCPKELKPCLLIDGEEIADCDISHAHHCFLPVVIEGRIKYMQRKGATGKIITDHQRELGKLRRFLSDGDYYRKLSVDPTSDRERDEKKLLLTMLLNFPNEKARKNGLYCKLKRKFPRTFSIVEDIKNQDHRTLGIQLRSFTAQTINEALLAMQAKVLPCIPHTDSIMCRRQDKETACREIGAALHKLSGVSCKVGGIRHHPEGGE